MRVEAFILHDLLTSQINCEDGGSHAKEKMNVNHTADIDINNAVELSIAASEALVIHELLKTGSGPELFPAGAILEAALRVKQARLETLKDAMDCPVDEIDENDSLSVLDDSVMVDAFLDIGVSFSGSDSQHRGCGVSRVQDTPMVENNYGHENESAEQNKNFNDSALHLNSNVNVCLADNLNQPAEGVSQALSVERPQVDVRLSNASVLENAEGEDKPHYSVADRFQSCWLGGWTMKEAAALAKLNQNTTRIVSKPFVGETSFLSESADVAPDENSFVQEHETGSRISSHTSIKFEGLHDKVVEESLISQEARSSSQSLVDPLCSFVPCSISSENVGSSLAQNQNDRKVDAENCFNPKSVLGNKNFQRTSDLNDEHTCLNKEGVPSIASNHSGVPVLRKTASLKTYSTLLPKWNATLEGGRLYHNQQFVPEYVEEDQIRSFDQSKSKGLLPFMSVFECVHGRDDDEEKQEDTVVRNSVAGITVRKRNQDEPSNAAAELLIQPSVQRKSPIVLNRKKACCHPSEILNRERNPKHAVGPDTIVYLQQSKNLLKIQSKPKNPHMPQNLAAKRVSFSEVEVKHQQKRQRTLSRKCQTKELKRLIFRDFRFLLTGFSTKEERELVVLIQNYGGMVLFYIPSPPSNSRSKRISNFQQLPIILCSRKLQTSKFLYGCAVNALILRMTWLTDSIAAGSVVPPDKYIILPNQADLLHRRNGNSISCNSWEFIFATVGIMLHGKDSFCTKLAVIIKHGGGRVFKTLQRLLQSLDAGRISVGAIVVEDESRALRHLKHCATERKIPMMPTSWIVKSLHLGKLLPFKERNDTPLPIKAPEVAASSDWSEEI